MLTACGARWRGILGIGCVAFAGMVSACGGDDSSDMSGDNPSEDSGMQSEDSGMQSTEPGSSHEGGATAQGTDAGEDATHMQGSAPDASNPAGLDAGTGGGDSGETNDTGTTTGSTDAGTHPDAHPSDAQAADTSIPPTDAGHADTGSVGAGVDAEAVDTGAGSPENDATVAEDTGASSGEQDATVGQDAGTSEDAGTTEDAATTEDARPEAAAEAPDTSAPVSYATGAKPIFEAKCAPCHTTGGSDGVNFAANYADTQRAANLGGACSGLTVGACTIVEIQAGLMPLGAGCTGNPSTDEGNPACLTAAQQETIQAWIDDGQQP